MSDGVTLKRIIDLDTQSSIGDGVYTIVDSETDKAKKFNLGGALSNLNDALNGMPELKSTQSDDADLDISDSSGNVLVEFSDGHIKTKNFDSSAVISPTTIVDSVSTSGSDDLDIADQAGNVLVEFSGGHIKTKAFDSNKNFVCERLEFSETVEYSGATSVFINHPFKEGDTIILHTSIVGNNITDSIGAYDIGYYGITSKGDLILLRTDYGYNFPKVTLDRDIIGVYVTLPGGLIWGESGSIKVIVYQTFGQDMITHELSVKPDGSGDYTTIKAALESMTDNNALTHYIVNVYPGTYNLASEFTSEEISAEGFIGWIVKNGVFVQGIGQRDDIIVTGSLSDDYSSIRNNISPFNMAGECGLKNMTIIANKLRYCIHDDIGTKRSIHIFEDLTLRPSEMTSASAYDIAYGAGFGNNKQMYFKNVDFGDAVSAHGSLDWSASPRLVFENCTAKLFQFGEFNSGENAYITLNNCKGVALRMTRDSSHAQYTRLDGVGTDDIIMDCYPGFVYDLGQCRKYEDSYNFSVGQAVKLGTSYGLVATTDKYTMIGIVLGKLDGDTYIQTGGYIDANTFGITGLSVGDYVHLDSNGILASGGSASDAVGIVISTSTFEGGAFIKML